MRVTLRKKKLKDGRNSFYLDIYHQGKRNYEYLNIYLEKNDNEKKEKTTLANNIRAKREIELANNQHGFVPEFKKRTSLLKFVESVANSKTKARDYKAMYLHLKQYSNGEVYFSEVDEKWIEGFKEYLLKRNKINTSSTYFAKFKYCFKLARKEKLIFTDILANVKNIPNEDVQRNYLVENEIKILAKTECQIPEIKRAFLFSCFTGLRFSDIQRLTYGDIKNNTIQLRQLKTNDLINVPLSKTASELINNGKPNLYYLPNNLVFNTPQNTWTNVILRRWFEDAHISKNAHFHLARHTFATLNITNGAELYTVSKLLGHKSIKNTEIYANLVDEKRKEAMDRLPEIQFNK